MTATSTLTKGEHVTKENPNLPAFYMNDVVKSASRVIAPLWPLDTFAARSPWAELEGQRFEQVARWLKDARDVEIYPSASMIRAAWNRGEIDKDFLEIAFQRWLDSQSLDLPREVIERFCRARLQLDELSADLLTSSELASLAKKLSRFEPHNDNNESIKPLSLWVEQQKGEKIAHTLDHLMIKWCKLYLDESQAAWSMPHREKGFYQAWRQIASHDPALTRSQRKQLKHWPQEASTALKQALSRLEIPQSQVQGYLEAHLLTLPGWAGMMLWRSQHSTEEHSLLTEYLAVRLSLESVLLESYFPIPEQTFTEQGSLVHLLAAWSQWGGLPLKAWTQMSTAEIKERLNLADCFDDMMCRRLWLEAWEETYTDQLSEMLSPKKQLDTEEKKPPLAQFAFCIDVRSEPFRRKLEKVGDFETLGVAGFFGLPIETSELDNDHAHPSLPIILKPQHKVKEAAPESEHKSYQQRRQTLHSFRYTFKKLKQNLFTSLVLPEISGPWLSLKMFTNTFIPRTTGRTVHRLQEKWLRKPRTELTLDQVHTDDGERPVGFSEEEKVQYVRQALKSMGLTERFAPLVVICGHGSQNNNNPYAAALECGACGGASGEFNARVLASLCNLPEVREALAAEGIEIPKDTVFVAAEHVTTLDELRWLDVPELSNAAQKAFDQIEAVLPKVRHEVNAERLSQLPNIGSQPKNPVDETNRFAEDWSEIRPEWGLARNASFIIGSRRLTEECNLEGRAFLHNYDWRKDKDGTLLANIIGGPGTVAQWINLQYYASTVAPHYYGSGNKATQTVTSGLGVMQGNASDLLFGLPWQSVMKSDDEAYHAPLRLLVVIEAPREYVERLLEHQPAFRQKIENGWLRLATIDPDGHWESWSEPLSQPAQPVEKEPAYS